MRAYSNRPEVAEYFLRIILNCTNPARRGEGVWGGSVHLPRIGAPGVLPQKNFEI